MGLLSSSLALAVVVFLLVVAVVVVDGWTTTTTTLPAAKSPTSGRHYQQCFASSSLLSLRATVASSTDHHHGGGRDEPQQITTTTIPTSDNSVGALSLTMEELGDKLNGHGRARLCWDLYRIGVDPALYYDSTTTSEEERQEIQKLLPSNRQSQTLGQEALQRLSDLYANYPHGRRVQDGVTSLSHVSTSRDGTTKLLLRLKDGLEVETVIIPWEGVRSTLCISSQVGCAQGCQFCATGKMGKLRSLASEEILAQMFYAQQIIRLHKNLPPISNVVFMGLGEPSDNADNVVVAARQLTTRGMFQLSAQKVTVSTVAPTPLSFHQFQDAPCVLAWSVHAVDDKLRKRLVPTTRHTMVELRQGLMDTLNQRPINLRTTMLEVVLLKNVNDSLEHADELAEFAQVIIDSVENCKLVLNLIPYNPIQGSPFEKPTSEASLAFQQRLQYKHGLYAFVRVTRGDDESAACGQLITTTKRKGGSNVTTPKEPLTV